MRYDGIMFMFFFFKQKTEYEMRISDWSSDVCSSDLETRLTRFARPYNGCNASVRPPQDRQRSVWAKRNTSGKTSPYRRFVNWNRIHGLRKLNHLDRKSVV